MRIPVPRNKLVAFTLIGALLTSVVAVGLAVPGLDSGGSTDSTGTSPTTTVAADAPTPNPDFTPAVSRSGADDHAEHEEEWEDDEYEDDDDHEAEDEDDYEAEEEDEYEDDDDHEAEAEDDHEEGEDR